MAAELLTYPALAARLRALPPSCGEVRVVGIDGPSGSGKSTLTDRLAGLLPEAAVVRSDEFPVPWDGEPLAWWPPVDGLILRRLGLGVTARYRPYDWKSGTHRPAVSIPPTVPVLLLDGVGAASRRCPAALRIWVEAPRELRRRRALERDGQEYGPAWDRWARRESVHFAADRTREHADLIVDGANSSPGSVTVITLVK
jgi:uridine kinase